MITENYTDQQAFQQMLQKMYVGALEEKDPTRKLKEKAWLRFLEIGLPTRQSEVFQYLRLRNLYIQAFETAHGIPLSADSIAPHILPECSGSVLVMINGDYYPELSNLSALPKRMVILPLKEAWRTYGSFLNNQWNKLLIEEKDPFAILNAALHRQGIFIYAPPKTLADVPLQLLHFNSHEPDLSLWTNPRIQGFIGAHSQLDLIATHVDGPGKQFLSNLSIELAMDEESHLRYFQVPFEILNKHWYFEAFRASLKKGSTFKSVLASKGSTSLRNDYRVVLAGENAEASLNGLWMLSDQAEAHANILVEHQAPYCRSMQLFKSVLNDASHSSFEGKILVHQAAQKTQAFQLNSNLLLSDKAKADSKPNLEIFADDVKASHGATMGQLDQEQLFYLRTRGYSEKAAKNLLVYGFCKEIIEMIPYPSLMKAINKQAYRYLMQEPGDETSFF
ncbi:Fe-S cluster assembly protein SufD [Neochlamydia sp. EPS4]|uniref:Fe-S cluster assembly protein SufD n=1 Tax=Neochlamydia sp. EPS4 TaxID=1478175 RepID=UPI0005D12B44|nr:Fe-S cluster assembly protein SufD [Neochlamydia sp. EPS4]